MHAAKARRCEIVLPADVVVASEFKAGRRARVVRDRDAGRRHDPRRRTQDGGAHRGVLGDCKTLLWNGPLGAFEIAPSARARSRSRARRPQLTKAGKLVSVAGGGDTVAALNAAGVTDEFTYVSTAGGAFLEWLEGRELPGVAALIKAQG